MLRELMEQTLASKLEPWMGGGRQSQGGVGARVGSEAELFEPEAGRGCELLLIALLLELGLDDWVGV